MTNPEVFSTLSRGLPVVPRLRPFVMTIYGLFWSNRFSRRKRTVMPSRVSTWLPPGTFRP